MNTLLQDLRYALRTLLRAPGFSAVAVLTLALGIGATTTVFTVVDGTLLRPLPYAEPERLVATSSGFMRGEYEIVRAESRTLAEVALYQAGIGFTLSGEGDAAHLTGALVTPNLFPLLGVAPLLGRLPTAEEGGAGAEPVVVLSHALWRERFGGDPSAVGATALVDGVSRTIVGVLPPEVYFPEPGTRLWVPLVVNPADLGTLWGMWGGNAVARLAPGATVAAATAELRGFGDRLRHANPFWTPGEDYLAEAAVTPLREATVGDQRTLLLVLLGSVALVLLIACANIGNLQLARGLARRRELAVRAALGATRRRLARQLFTESLLLALAGGVAGAAVAAAGVRVFLALLPGGLPRAPEVAVDPRALGFALAITLLAGLAAGLVPAWRLARSEVRDGLAAGAGLSSRGATRRLSSSLVVAQLALALVLVTGAVLLALSLRQLMRVDPGFRTEQLVAAPVNPPAALYQDGEGRRALYEALMERVAAIPGVAGVAATSQLPFDQEWQGTAVFVRGFHTDPRAPLPVFEQRRVTPGYFATLGIPLLAGRDIDARDRADAPLAVVIDELAAERFFPGEDPLGREIGFPWADRWMTVVGVVGTVRNNELTAEREPAMYVPFEQDPTLALTLVLRTALPSRELAPLLRATVAGLDDGVPLGEVRTVERMVAASAAEPRALAVLLGSFAALALLLAALGIYGVVSYTVRQRTREIGVRLALGARAEDVLRLVVRQGSGVAVAGIGMGVLASLALTRLLRSLLFEVSPTDPAVFAGVPLLLLAVALAASALPARRAARVDPITALRSE